MSPSSPLSNPYPDLLVYPVSAATEIADHQKRPLVYRLSASHAMDKKLSFSISSKSSPSKANHSPLKTSTFTDDNGHRKEDNSSHRSITEFDQTLDLNNHDSSKTQKLIIPPIENEYMAGKRTTDDVNRLADADESFDQFEEVPVEGFGAALMAGYGWKDGMGIGKNAKQDVEVVEFKRWAGRGGLGAFSHVDGNGN